MKSKLNHKKITFEDQLEIFKQLGFKLNNDIIPDDLLILVGKEELDCFPYVADYRWQENIKKVNPYSYDDVLKLIGREEIESEPFETLYYALADQTESLQPITNQCWYVDDYLLKNQGKNDYRYILENLKRVSNNELDFKKVKSTVNLESQKVFLSFVLLESSYNWEFQLEKWPASLFSKIITLSKTHNTSKQLTGLFFDKDKPSNGVVIGWFTNHKREEIIKKAGLDIQWLS